MTVTMVVDYIENMSNEVDQDEVAVSVYIDFLYLTSNINFQTRKTFYTIYRSFCFFISGLPYPLHELLPKLHSISKSDVSGNP